MMTFATANLLGDLPETGTFDIVLCRNIAFCFTPRDRGRLFDRVADRLRPGGGCRWSVPRRARGRRSDGSSGRCSGTGCSGGGCVGSRCVPPRQVPRRHRRKRAYTTPWSSMAFATRRKPATFAPLT
ncbi:MAG: hypothetical protein FJ087_07470 [Deltaproteobacteria bacterium]|nr:hypothetical protein [Deltaproteobacteria bacterium]